MNDMTVEERYKAQWCRDFIGFPEWWPDDVVLQKVAGTEVEWLFYRHIFERTAIYQLKQAGKGCPSTLVCTGNWSEKINDLMPNSKMFSHLNKSIVDVASAFRQLGEIFNMFGVSCYRDAELDFRRHHKRLPGSNATARLRKKRRNRVWKWMKRQMSD